MYHNITIEVSDADDNISFMEDFTAGEVETIMKKSYDDYGGVLPDKVVNTIKNMICIEDINDGNIERAKTAYQQLQDVIGKVSHIELGYGEERKNENINF